MTDDRPSADACTRRSFLGTASGAMAALSTERLDWSAFGANLHAATASAIPAPASPSLVAARAAVTAARQTIVKLSRDVWARPAVGLSEHEAMNMHIAVLEQAGFRITAREAAGHPTAFVAEWSQGTGGPKVGFLPEYDALPGLGNVAEPVEKPTSGTTDGHGCGHNMLGAGCTGAALALRAMMIARKTAGTVRVYGCGAEETEGAKVYMARAGLFDDLDAALAFHPAPVAVAGEAVCTATRNMKVRFTGRTAHAANTPWLGRSAVHAAELFAHGVNAMREHVEPTARTHYIYEIAGLAPNIVPDVAQIWLTTREKTTELVEANLQWLKEIAQGAAMATQTKAEVDVFFGIAELVPNAPLARRLFAHVSATPLDWSAAEQSFAKACQKAMKLPEAGMATTPMPYLPQTNLGGSTDVGDISWNTPTAVFGWPTLPLGVSLHSWPVTACGGMEIGDRGTLAAATIMAATGFDVLTDAELRSAARADFTKRLQGKRYVCGVPPERKTPLGASARTVKAPGEEGIAGTQAAS
ncbi:MAG: amidohydrolase [Gemmatimonadaceae bacterium]|nr:amidohydrolase [Gemmatimonadaceae bacterium]